MKAIIFCGFHHTGKTTFLEKALRALTARGRRVCVVKHASSPLDPGGKGKDSERYTEAGAAEVVILSGDRMSGETGTASRDPLGERLERTLDAMDADYALIEGFKGYEGPIPKIAFGRTRAEIEGLLGRATVGYSGFGLEEAGPLTLDGRSIPFVPPDVDPVPLADFIETTAAVWGDASSGRRGEHG